jgi:integrase
MPKSNRVPSLCVHKGTRQAYVTLNGVEHYLGHWPPGRRKPPASVQAKYEALIARWLAHGRRPPEPEAGLSVNEVLLAYVTYAATYYADGEDSTELKCTKDALGIVKQLWGRTPARNFGPKSLKSVREAMLARKWSRGYVNHQVSRVRRVFRWAVEEELLPGEVWHALRAVRAIRRGTPHVRETEPVRPVPQAWIEATLPHVPPPVAAMVRLQLLTAMRPGEACVMRAADIDTGGRVWVYRPAKHKSSHHGRSREIYIGPQAQAIIRPWLKLDTQAYLFSPADAEAQRAAARRAARKTPLWPSHARRLAAKKKRRRRRAPGDRYDVAGYRRAIARACDAAFPLPKHVRQRILPDGKPESKTAWAARLTPDEKAQVRLWQREHRWHPHQLRHNAATNLRRAYGVELARIVLGHASAFTTEIYAEADRQQAIEVLAKIG